MKNTWGAAVAALCAVLCSCKAPDHALYTSPARDFQCEVPWAWNVMYDREGEHFSHVNFIGPFEPDFYLGAPSYSVRWYTNYATHRLRDGQLEMYANADDFIRQTLDSVYGKAREMFRPVQDLVVDGRRFKYFVVLSAGPAQPGARWGTAVDETDKAHPRAINPRKHAYAVLPVRSGFYVLAYPATEQAYDADPQKGLARLKIYRDKFDQMVKTFVPLKDGPGGAPLPPPASGKTPTK